MLDETAIDQGVRAALYGERVQELDCVAFGPSAGAGLFGGVTTAGWKPLGWLIAPMFELDGAFMIEQTGKVIAATFQPNYPAARAMLPSYPSFGDGPRGFAHILSKMIYPSMTGVVSFRFADIATRRMTAVALAIRLYELDHGAWPGALDELVPDYLPAIPIDLFADDGRSIAYRPDAEPPVLYCVGLDGVDGGGQVQLRENGTVFWRDGDLLYFLNGDRPRDTQAVLDSIKQTEEDNLNQDD